MTLRTLNLSAADLARMDDIESEYSDLYKEMHGIRLSIAYWGGEEINVETAQRKLDSLYAERDGERSIDSSGWVKDADGYWVEEK